MALDLEEEVILSSHDTYMHRSDLYDYIQEVYNKKNTRTELQNDMIETSKVKKAVDMFQTEVKSFNKHLL